MRNLGNLVFEVVRHTSPLSESVQMRRQMATPTSALSDDERLVVCPRRARYMLDCGNTRLYELLKNNELESYLDGRSRKIIVASIHRYIARRLEAEKTAVATPRPQRRRGRPRKHLARRETSP
jgi:hypothetical protein